MCTPNIFRSSINAFTLNRLRTIHNKIVDSTNILIKSHSSHLNVNHLKVTNISDGNEILDKLDKISSCIEHPHYSHIFLKKK